jgi:3-phenylpropionate/trans-cinnamate dioxygenase ferredoxin reductase subunit
MLNQVVVVGASAAGLTAVEALRNKGYSGKLTLVGDEPEAPYDRPPLSKALLAGELDPEQVRLRDADTLSTVDAELRFGCRATGLDRDERSVVLSTGERLRYDAAIIATGLRPRRLRRGHGTPGVHVLRTMADALALRHDLGGSPRVVVVGAGFLGAEIAATTRGLGLEVTLVGCHGVPLMRQVGPEIGWHVAAMHRDHGVKMIMGVRAAGVREHHGRVAAVRFANGMEVPADVVVVAIGSAPAVDWLDGSGLDLADGVRCDEFCMAAPGIWAAGDVANWPHPLAGGRIRLEQRTNAAAQAVAVAGNVLAGPGAGQPYAAVPFGWTDQFDTKIQTFGWCPPEATVEIVSGSPADREFAAVFRKDGVVTGALGWNSIRGLRPYRQMIGRREPNEWMPAA